MHELSTVAWPASRLNEALSALADRGGLSPQDRVSQPPHKTIAADAEALGHWMRTAVSHIGIETQQVSIAYADLTSFLHTAAPAILQLPESDPPQFIALLATKRDKLTLLTPDLTTQQLPMETVRAALSHPFEAPILAETDELLTAVGTPRRRFMQARAAILHERLASARVGQCWLLTHSPGSSFWRQLRHAGVLRYFLSFLTTFTLQQALFVLSWWLIGRAVFQGRLETGWLLAWVLLLLTLIPLRLLGTWLQGITAVTLGGLLQKRLLYGTLRQEPDEIRHMGAGQLMGRVFEAESVESLSLSGGIAGLTALIELIIAVWILSVGAGGLWHASLLLIWIGITAIFITRFYQQRREWTHHRRHLTHELIEGMVGHRTRLMQTAPTQWHEGEDEALTDYIRVSAATDRAGAQLEIVASRGWVVVGFMGLLPTFLADTADPAALAISIGGIISANLALMKLTGGLINQLLAALIAWEQVAPIFKAATRPQNVGRMETAVSPLAHKKDELILQAHNLNFRYHAQGDPVLHHCQLEIKSGDRLLLEGASGGGKSTLGAILTGLRMPESGLLLLHGFDRRWLSDAEWRRFAISSPQFHENHVVSNTFLFNLLMGCQWPPTAADVQAAEALCVQLGLGKLLRTMPAGLLQMVGETGWQLSHGERSRLYIARALLQKADLIVLDESLAALDPENLQQVVHCVQEQATTLLLIAHP